MQRIDLFLALYHNTPYMHLPFTGAFYTRASSASATEVQPLHISPFCPFYFYFLTTGWHFALRLISNLPLLFISYCYWDSGVCLQGDGEGLLEQCSLRRAR